MYKCNGIITSLYIEVKCLKYNISSAYSTFHITYTAYGIQYNDTKNRHFHHIGIKETEL